MQLTTAMLADGAHVAQSKLYILGGQWDRLAAARFPVQHPSMTVVLVIKIDYNEAPKTCILNVELMLDGEPMGVKSVGSMSIGHAAGLARGAPQFAPVAITFNNVQFEKPGRYEWVISEGAEVLGQIPLEVVEGIEITASGPQSATAPEPTE
jgi:hypothetical protein